MTHRNDRFLSVPELARMEGADATYIRASRNDAAPGAPAGTVVIGIGNEFRRDDGIGPAIVAGLRHRVPPSVRLVISDGEPSRLLDAWTGAALAIVVDAVRAQPPHPGRVHRFVLDRPYGGAPRSAGSHGLGLDDAIGLALALDRMPGRLIVHAVEALDLTPGTGLTPPVAAAAGAVTAAVLADMGLPPPGRDNPRAEEIKRAAAADVAAAEEDDKYFRPESPGNRPDAL